MTTRQLQNESGFGAQCEHTEGVPLLDDLIFGLFHFELFPLLDPLGGVSVKGIPNGWRNE